MTRHGAGAGSLRSTVLRLSADDWSRARSLAPNLAETLRNCCQVHRNQHIFDPSGGLTPVVQARLANLSPANLLIALSPLLDALGERRGAIPGGGAGDLLAELTAGTADEPGADREPGEPPGDAGELARLVADLHHRQPAVLGALDRVRARVQEGALGEPDDLRLLEAWQSGLVNAAGHADLAPEGASLSVIGQAARAMEAARAAAHEAAHEAARKAAREQAQLRRILDEIVAAEPGPSAGAVFEPVAEQARNADPATMPAETREAFLALHRLLSVPVHAVDQSDADAVQEAFGLLVMLAAASGTLARVPTEPEPEPEPETKAEAEPETEHETEHEVEPEAQPQLASITPAPQAEPALAESAESAEDGAGDALDLRIADAIAGDRNSLAYWYAVALGLPAPVQTAFEVFALSEGVVTDGDDCSMQIRDLLHGFDVTSVAHNPQFVQVMAAGSARALLRMPFSPCGEVLQDSVELLSDCPEKPLLQAVLSASTFGFDLAKLRDGGAQSLPELIARRDAALGRLRESMADAQHVRIRFVRASGVWHRLISEKGALGYPASAILADSENLDPAREALAQLRDLRAIDRLIDDTDARLNPVSARRNKIIAGARDTLRDRAFGLLDVLRGYVDAAHDVASGQRSGASDQINEVLAALTRAVSLAADGPDEDLDAGRSALRQVRNWLDDSLVRRRPARKAQPAAAVLGKDLSRAFELERGSNGTVAPESVTQVILDAIKDRSAEDAYAGYAANDDHFGAEFLIDVLRDDGNADLADRLAERRQEDERISRERLRRLAADTERELARALSTALLSESEIADLRGEVDRLGSADITDFPSARRRLNAIAGAVAGARDRAVESARQQLAVLDCPEATRDRILRQLDDGDLITAQEFLAQLAMGTRELPPEQPPDETLRTFWPDFAGAIEAKGPAGQPGGPDRRALPSSDTGPVEVGGLTLLAPDASRLIAKGLDAWHLLMRDKRGNARWQQSLKDALRMIGLDVTGQLVRERSQGTGWPILCEATPAGNALVPSYGSSCGGRYRLLLCWDRMSADSILGLVDELPQAPPVIVLYFNTLPGRERRALAERSRTRNRNTSAVVVDHAVITFLASQPEPRLQTTMRVTLPFTAVNPYTPFVLGDVPREVFYGRRGELRRVLDANDALFVYGGRQLGKSALLKTAKREFAETDYRWHSIYVDLKAEGIGEWREPDGIWPVLLPHLKNLGIADAKVSPKAPPEAVVTQVRHWLDEDKERRILLLLDEADAFLETDARPRSGMAGEARFVNIYRLKSLMDGSDRRFKPVFAGLHQVQRFHSASNGPMAHVGAEILIGPLPPSEAYRLVTEPLAAIGYQVANPDVAWRLLAYTNYQASLIQLFCDALVRRLHGRALKAAAPPTVITDRDIDDTYSDREVRQQIADRFEWTINLDNRYRVIAYTTAWLTLNAERQVFTTTNLYDDCRTFWPGGFDGQTLDEFSSNLDEMVGLGVLVGTPTGEYGIRSPNVIRLLGAPEEIERRLYEAERLELSRPFDPAIFRRALGSDPDRRSPLSEQQVQQVLGGRRRVHVIVGSKALGLDRVAEALAEAAPEDMHLVTATCQTLPEALSRLPATKAGRRHIVLDLGGADQAGHALALQRLHRRALADNQLTASCLAPPSACWLWEGEVPGIEVDRVRIRPWTSDSLRAWAPDCAYPLSTADQRAQLLEATGGWPQLVEAAVHAARGGASAARACQEAEASVSGDVATREFLMTIGLWADPVADEIAQAAASWLEEIGFDDLAQLVEAEREAVLAATSRLVDLAVLQPGSGGDAYRINPVVARLLRSE